jgi:methyl halide transferase
MAGNTNSLDSNYWDERYLSDTLPWDLGEVSPPIKTYIDGLADKTIRILIPGCGNAYEARYLLKKGFTNITLIDIAVTLTTRLKKKYAGNAAIKILQVDFFEHRGEYDLILEQTFFCALQPVQRTAYRDKMFSLLSPNGLLAGLLFNKEFESAGPPFGGTKIAYKKLFKSRFEFHVFEECNCSFTKRLGTELFMVLKKRMRSRPSLV